MKQEVSCRRFKDVLLALYVANEFDSVLPRIRLQKFIYLVDVFLVIWREISKPSDFFPYLHGPYDRQIQSAVDALAFQGFATCVEFNISIDSKIHSKYKITDAGIRAVDSLLLSPIFQDEYQLFLEIANEINNRGWKNIVKIVYAEPTFHAAKSRGERGQLPITQSTGNQCLALGELFKSAWMCSRDRESRWEPKIFVQIIFLVIDEFREKNSSVLGDKK